MTERAGTRDRPAEPDPTLFEQFCHEIVPDLLTEVCHVDEKLAAKIGHDILARGESYAALDDATRDVLMSPFAEEVVEYEPSDASVSLKGAVAVVVRSSLIEDVHSSGLVEAGTVKFITTRAAGPLSHFLAARRRRPVRVKQNVFAGLADASPLAWACLGAVVLASSAGGGRWPYHVTAAPVPELPVAEVEAPRADNRDYAVLLSGVDARFDELFVRRMRECAEDNDTVFVVASLSRISRHVGKLLRAMEYLLAHNVPILTSNYLLRANEVWVRRGDLVPVDRDNLLAALRDTRGLSGAHRATVAKIVKDLEAQESADGD